MGEKGGFTTRAAFSCHSNSTTDNGWGSEAVVEWNWWFWGVVEGKKEDDSAKVFLEAWRNLRYTRPFLWKNERIGTGF
jgi:hypothetical protein